MNLFNISSLLFLLQLTHHPVIIIIEESQLIRANEVV